MDLFKKKLYMFSGGRIIEIASIDKELARIKGHPRYSLLKEEAEQIRQRIIDVGFACAAQLNVIGINPRFYS